MSINNFDIVNNAEQQVNNEISLPRANGGYTEVRLSTKGMYGAPEVFHIRNLTTEEVMQLSLVEKEQVPIEMAKLLQAIIMEPQDQVNVLEFHEMEASELALFLKKTYYESKIKGIPWHVTDEDKEFIRQNVYPTDDDAYNKWLLGVRNGQRKYEFDIDLNTIEYWPAPEKPIKALKVKDPVSKLECKFTWPHFGDVVVLKKALDNEFKERDKKYEHDYAIFKRRQEAERSAQKGELVDLSKVPMLPKAQEEEIRKYETEKTLFLITMTKGLHLAEIDGNDVSTLPLAKRAELAQDSRISYTLYQRVSEIFDKMKVGPKKQIKIKDPVIGKEVEYEYPFRVYDILATIGSHDDDGITYEFE